MRASGSPQGDGEAEPIGKAPDPVQAGAVRPGRKRLHMRSIELHGYQRDDGLFEVEASMVDRKPDDYKLIRGGRVVPAGEAVHDLSVRIVFDADLVVHDIETATHSAPHPECAGGGAGLKALRGAVMSRGWTTKVRELTGGARSCTHLRELLLPLATVALQSLSALRSQRPEPVDASGRPLKIDSCHAYAAQSPVVLRYWPQHHEPHPRSADRSESSTKD